MNCKVIALSERRKLNPAKVGGNGSFESWEINLNISDLYYVSGTAKNKEPALHFPVNTAWPHNCDEISAWGSPRRNNIAMLNNSLLSRKYLHHEICDTIKYPGKVSRKQTVLRCRDIRLPLYYRALNKKTSLWLSVKSYRFKVAAWRVNFFFLSDEWNTQRHKIVTCD